jgi:hypothetical protein
MYKQSLLVYKNEHIPKLDIPKPRVISQEIMSPKKDIITNKYKEDDIEEIQTYKYNYTKNMFYHERYWEGYTFDPIILHRVRKSFEYFPN